MKKISCYVHPIRTYLPCTGAGRHINSTVLGLSRIAGVDCELLCSRQWLGDDGRLDRRSPLRDLPLTTFAFPERLAEWAWKATEWPNMDRFVAGSDWIYCPSETLFPSRSVPVATTFFDLHPLDPIYLESCIGRSKWQTRRWSRWVKRSMDRAELILTISEFTKARMVDLLGINPDKVRVIGCAVEERFYHAGGRRLSNPDSLLPTNVLVVGGLGYRKAGDLVLNVARELSRMGSPINIEVAGRNEPRLEGEARRYSNVRLLGILSDEELLVRLTSSAALMMLSRYEGFGIPPAEAMACGVPAIVSNTTSLPEVVGEGGIVVALDSPDDTAEALDLLVRDSAYRQRWVERGRIQAEKHRLAQVMKRLGNALGISDCAN